MPGFIGERRANKKDRRAFLAAAATAGVAVIGGAIYGISRTITIPDSALPQPTAAIPTTEPMAAALKKPTIASTPTAFPTVRPCIDAQNAALNNPFYFKGVDAASYPIGNAKKITEDLEKAGVGRDVAFVDTSTGKTVVTVNQDACPENIGTVNAILDKVPKVPNKAAPTKAPKQTTAATSLCDTWEFKDPSKIVCPPQCPEERRASIFDRAFGAVGCFPKSNTQ